MPCSERLCTTTMGGGGGGEGRKEGGRGRRPLQRETSVATDQRDAC